MNRVTTWAALVSIAAAFWISVGCASGSVPASPTVPLVINMNAKIDPEIRVRVEKDLDEQISQEKDIF